MGRNYATSRMTFYVNGNSPAAADTPSNGLSAATPWKTLGYTFLTLIGGWDFGIYGADVLAYDPTNAKVIYPEALYLQKGWTGGAGGVGTVRLLGNPTASNLCVIQPPANNQGVSLNTDSTLVLMDMMIDMANAPGCDALATSDSAKIDLMGNRPQLAVTGYPTDGSKSTYREENVSTRAASGANLMSADTQSRIFLQPGDMYFVNSYAQAGFCCSGNSSIRANTNGVPGLITIHHINLTIGDAYASGVDQFEIDLDQVAYSGTLSPGSGVQARGQGSGSFRTSLAGFPPGASAPKYLDPQVAWN